LRKEIVSAADSEVAAKISAHSSAPRVVGCPITNAKQTLRAGLKFG
jgi:hypothetical protein